MLVYIEVALVYIVYIENNVSFIYFYLMMQFPNSI